MQSLPKESGIISQQSEIKDTQPWLQFIHGEEWRIPYMTYKIKDNRLYVTMRCNTLDPHVATISYNDYKNRTSCTSNITSQGINKCDVHTTKDSVGYCQQLKKHLCIVCKQSHMHDHPDDFIPSEHSQNNDLNKSLKCKEHPSCSLILYCEQCKISLCPECATDKHQNHPTLNIKQLITGLNIVKLKEDIIIYEENYFNAINSAYAQAQQELSNDDENRNCINKEELKNDYENHKSVNRELFGVVKDIFEMWDMFKESYDFNLFNNVNNIVNNLNTRNLFNYRPGNVHELHRYLKTNLVLNIHNINDWNSTIVTGFSNSPIDNPSGVHNTNIEKNEELGSTTHKTTAETKEEKWGKNVKAFEWITTVEFENRVYSLCKLNDHLYAAGVGLYNSSGTIHIVEYSNNAIIRSWTGHSKGIWRWYWHKKSDHLLSWSFDSDIRIWNHCNGNCLYVLRGHGGCARDVVELNDGNIITVSDDFSIKYWNMSTFQCYRTIKDAHSDRITCVTIADRKHWITGGFDECWKIWKPDANGKNDISNSINTGYEIWSLFEANNNRWLVGLDSGDILVYDINDFTQVAMLEQHTKGVYIMMLLSNGDFISGSDDSKLIIWDITTGSCIQRLEEHTSYIYTGWIEMRDNEILTGSGDNTVKKWIRKR